MNVLDCSHSYEQLYAGYLAALHTSVCCSGNIFPTPLGEETHPSHIYHTRMTNKHHTAYYIVRYLQLHLTPQLNDTFLALGVVHSEIKAALRHNRSYPEILTRSPSTEARATVLICVVPISPNSRPCCRTSHALRAARGPPLTSTNPPTDFK